MKTPKPQPVAGTLARQFVAPPFSILDTKQGYWRQRKKAWLALGIDDQGASRSGMRTVGDFSGSDPSFYKKKNALEAQLGRTITTAEFAAKHYDPSAATSICNDGGGLLSVFDPVLAEVCYRWFCPPGGRTLDPFAGGAVRGMVAGALGRPYEGVDLSAPQIAANRKLWRGLPPAAKQAWAKPKWTHGDSRDLLSLARGSFDFMMTCPPYADLEKYSDDPRDLSNMPYGEFRAGYQQVIAASTAMLKQDRFAAIVVGDVRDRRGLFRNFVSHTIEAFEGAGLRLYNEAVLATMLGSVPMRAGRTFAASRKLAKVHQNVLVFVKGNAKAAAQAVGPVELPVDPAELIPSKRRSASPSAKPKLVRPTHTYLARRAA